MDRERGRWENAPTRSSVNFQKADDLQHRLSEMTAFQFSWSK